jgi:phosphoglycolate phosphatase
MKLVIFDMDQTLIEFIDVHDEAARQLFKKFFNVDARLTEIDYAGKSLYQSFREMAKLKNIPEDRFLRHKDELLRSYEDAFARNIPADAEKYILPGVKTLLAELDKTDNIIMLYTGDSRVIVESVFKATGLGKYFRACFYGTEVESRADMINQAINRAVDLTGKNFTGKNIVIIGDSLRDIDASKKYNALMIAVATGIYSKDKLKKAGADYVFKDLADFHAVMRAIATG